MGGEVVGVGQRGTGEAKQALQAGGHENRHHPGVGDHAHAAGHRDRQDGVVAALQAQVLVAEPDVQGSGEHDQPGLVAAQHVRGKPKARRGTDVDDRVGPVGDLAAGQEGHLDAVRWGELIEHGTIVARPAPARTPEPPKVNPESWRRPVGPRPAAVTLGIAPKILITALMVGAGAVAAAGPAAAAPSTLAQEAQPFHVAASEGVVAWSSWDARDRIYRLVALRDGQRTVLPVPGSPEPFDVDLGTSRSGALVAVYSRKVNQSRDLFRYSFAGAKETRLTSLSRSDTDERQPTVWRGDIAFVRASTKTTRIMVGDTGRTASPRTLLSRRVNDGTFTHPELTTSRGLCRVAYVLTSPGRHGFAR